MARRQILVTNDDGFDAPGLAALKAIAANFGDVYTVAPRDPHSYAGHRVTTDASLILVETFAHEYHLSGTPADCVRVALSAIAPQVNWVLSGINRGGNLGADIYSSGTVAAAREAALLGRPAIAISQYVRRDFPLDWKHSGLLAARAIERILAADQSGKQYWNVNLPHMESGALVAITDCDPDDQPLDVQFQREGNTFRYSGSYAGRPRTAGRDIEHCFQGAITVSRLHA